MTDAQDAPTADLLAVYDTRLRGEAEMGSTTRRRRIGAVWVGEFDSRGSGFVSHPPLDAVSGDELDDLVDAVVTHFRDTTSVREFEWKTRGHDTTPGLTERLGACGFVPEEVETVLLGHVSDVARTIADDALPAGVVVREVGTADASLESDLDAAITLQEKVFGHLAGTVDDAVRTLERRPGL